MAEAPDQRPSVFISYAHKDGMDFTRRLAFALGLYVDVFWDRRLQSGPYPAQLLKEIESRGYFLLVMSPYSLESVWCRKELEHAQEHNPGGIMLARIYPECSDQELQARYTYGDFTEDFEPGFRRLTAMMLGEPLSSWEQLPHASDELMLTYLQRGFVPGLIAKTVAEWALVDRLWPYLEDYITEYEKQRGTRIIRGTPRTPMGILRQCQPLLEQFSQRGNWMGVYLVKQARQIVSSFSDDLKNLRDDNHLCAGEIAFNILTNVRELLTKRETARLDAYNLVSIQSFFSFDVAEKLRELINTHARRSRYLY